MIVGQDWISEDYLNKNSAPEKRQKRRELGQDPNLVTNKNLKRLLKDHFDLSFSDTYATDVLVFIKRGRVGSTLLYVRYCPDSDKILDRTEMARWARCRLMHRSKLHLTR